MPGPAAKSSGPPVNDDSGAAAPAGAAAGAPGEATSARPIRDGVGLGLAVGVSGVAFGAAAVSSGLSTWQACALSLLAFTGASQFALAGVIAGGGSLLAGTAGAILLGSRNTLYGLRLAGLLRPRGPLRLLTALGVIDETTAITLAQPDPAAARTGFTATFCCLYLTWNLATLAGALGADRLGSPQTFGLDVVGPAAFLALIWPRLRAGRTDRMVALGGVAIAVGTTPVLPVGVPVILAATAALAGALRGQATDDSRAGSGARPASTATGHGHGSAAVRDSEVTEEAGQ
jgi:predicted branched-subunit amino acid permease